MRKSRWVIALLFVAIGAPNVRAGSITQVLVTGGAEACVYNYGGPGPLYLCVAGGIKGSFNFDTLTNSIVGPYSIDWSWLEGFGGDGSNSGIGSASISGSDLANDTFNFNGLVFSDLGLANFPCPIDNGGDFCRANAELIPVATVEPSSILLFGTSIFGLMPFRRKLFGP
jgi:hypothetical protein